MSRSQRLPLLHPRPALGYVRTVRRCVAVAVALSVLPVGAAAARPRTDGSEPAPNQISRLVTHVPARVLNQVGVGEIFGPGSFPAMKLHRPLSQAGKPEVLTMNLAWCPHCAANSWSLAIALSRFGNLTDLRTINTGKYYCKLAAGPCALSPAPCYPFTHGLSFLDASYRSRYLSLGAVVLQDVRGHNLERLTRTEFRAISPFDPGASQTPALSVGGAFGFLGPGYDPGSLVGKTWSQIAVSLADPHTPTAQHIDGLANLFTAAFCKVTKGRPRAVCTSKGVRAAAGRLRHAPPPPPQGGPF